MSHITEALQLLRETQGILKSAYQPMLDPAAQGGMPPQGGQPPMDPAMQQQMMAQGGQPPMDPAMMQQMMAAQGGQPPMDPAAAQGGAAPAPGGQIDPQVIMEMMSALESVGHALESLVQRVGAMEKEHKSMMKDFLQSRGEMKILTQFLKQQSPMGSEVMGSQPAAGMQGAPIDPALMGGPVQ